ncbi:hypothetical protein SSX86_018954 [Deinandra increscens subsp. villosa]|uniref:U1-type domain-containing protein n=1 Tax=Deinandra increscens subsp. villosa TaxID=3103831 RepID=A0AAP0GU03_9ASTR
MHPSDFTYSDIYARQHHQQTSQYYSHFPAQNPNPYPLHQQHHLRTEPYFTGAATNPDPPGVDAYLRSYSSSHAGAAAAYSAHHAGGLTYSHTIGAAPPPPAYVSKLPPPGYVSELPPSSYVSELPPPSYVSELPPPGYVSELVPQNWAPEESFQQYGNTLYAVGATVHQDVSQQLLPAIPTHSTWANPNLNPNPNPNTNPVVQSHGHWKKIPKKTKIAQAAWCEVCKIACNTGDVLLKHKLGRKHIKNVEKLISAASVATTSTTTSKPVIGPPEKPKKGNSGIKKKAETSHDLEIKRMKVLQGGAAVNAVRTCSICNVVCNSDTVFKFHLDGQKHASMVKSLQQPGVV